MKVAIVLLTILLFTYVHVRHAINGYDLPLFPTDIWKEKDIIYTNGFKDATKFIPRHVWIAVRNSSDEKPKHTAALMDKNKLWNFHFYGNEEKDEFMKKHYSGTSILWAYEILNPAIGCSRPEIWRLAILFKYGGVYMDDDSTIETELDSVVGPQDKFIGGKEPYNFDDRCYRDDYPLSNRSMNIRFGEKNRQDLIGGKFLFNWALFSAPHHPVLVRTLEHIVQLLKLEYLGVSAVKMHVSDHRGKLLMCATTFPITHSIHELLLEDSKGERRDDLGIRIGGEYFKEYGARMKAWYNDFRHDHWVKVIHKNRAPYLLEYAPPHVENYEGKVIQFPGHREIYLVKNKQKRAFPNMDTLIGMNFTLDDVRVLPLSFADKIVLGAPLPVMDSESLL